MRHIITIIRALAASCVCATAAPVDVRAMSVTRDASAPALSLAGHGYLW